VILDIDAEGSDYINASFIDVRVGVKHLEIPLLYPTYFLGSHAQEGVHSHPGTETRECDGLLAHDPAVQCAGYRSGYPVSRGQYGKLT